MQNVKTPTTQKDNSRMSAEIAMREVVERLRTEGSEALPGLVALDQALQAILQNLRGITLAFHEVHATAVNFAEAGDDSALRLNALQDRTGRLDALMGQSLIAFEQLCGGVQLWNIAGTRSGSSAPGSSAPPASAD